MVMRRQSDDRPGKHCERRQCTQRSAPGYCRATAPNVAPGLFNTVAAALRHCCAQRHRNGEPDQQCHRQSAESAQCDIPRPVSPGIFQMHPAMPQSRKIAHFTAVRQQHGFLGIKMRSQRCGIGFFAFHAQGLQGKIQQAAQFRGVSHLAVLRRQCRAVMHGIEQAGQHKSGENHRRRHAAGTAADPGPRRTQMRPGTRVCCIPDHGSNQQPDQRVRPQQFEAERQQVHEKRTRGSTSV